MLNERNSIHKMNMFGDKDSPCLMPLKVSNHWVGSPIDKNSHDGQANATHNEANKLTGKMEKFQHFLNGPPFQPVVGFFQINLNGEKALRMPSFTNIMHYLLYQNDVVCASTPRSELPWRGDMIWGMMGLIRLTRISRGFYKLYYKVWWTYNEKWLWVGGLGY